MPSFKILPTDLTFGTVIVDAADSSGILAEVTRFGCDEADVLQDEVYLFSVRINADGIWHIFQRDFADTIREIPVFG